MGNFISNVGKRKRILGLISLASFVLFCILSYFLMEPESSFATSYSVQILTLASLATSITTFLGFIITSYTNLRKELRETRTARLELEKKQLEVEKLRQEIESMKAGKKE